MSTGPMPLKSYVNALRQRVGDELAAETWRDIATAAERTLRESGGYQVF